MKEYFNLAIWVFTIICLPQKLNKCSDNILYSSSFSGNYISPCQISHSLLFTRAANNLGIQDDESKENSNRSRRASESSISSTDFSSSDSESIENDDSFSSSDGVNSDFELPDDACIANRLKSYLALRLPDKFGQPSNPLRRNSSLNLISSDFGHYDTNCDSGDLGDSDSDGSDSSSLFPTEGDIVTRLKSYLASKLPEQFPQPSNSLRRTKSLSSINVDSRRHSTVYITDDSFDSDSFSSDDSDDTDLPGARACNFHSLPDLCSGSLDTTNSNQKTVDNKKATSQSIRPESTLSKSYSRLESSLEKPFYSKPHRPSRSGLLGLRQKVISLGPLFSTKVTSYRSPNPILTPSCIDQKDPRSNVDPRVTNNCSVSNIKLATPTRTTKKRVVKKEALIKRGNSLSMHSPTFSKTMPERRQSAILRSAYGSNLQGPSFQSSSVMSNTKSSSKGRAPPPPAHPPYSVKTGTKSSSKRRAPPPPAYPPYSVKTETKKPRKRRAPPPPTNSPYSVKTETKNLRKHRASPPLTSPPCSVKTETKKPRKRRAPPPPTNPPYSVKTETKNLQEYQAPPPTHSQSSVKARTRSSNKYRAPSPPSTRPYSPERLPTSSSQELTLLPSIQRGSQSSRAIQKSLQAVTSNPRRRSSSSPPSLPPSPLKHSSSSSSPSQRPIRQRSSSLPPRISQQHEHAPTASTSEPLQSSQSKQRPPRPPLPTIQSIHIQRMFNA